MTRPSTSAQLQLSVLLLALIGAALLAPAPIRSASSQSATLNPSLFVPVVVMAPTFTLQPFATPVATAAGPSSAPATHGPSATVGTSTSGASGAYARSLSGIASWGDFGGHVVTRLPRGTRIEVVGPHGTWRGVSWGYGPAKWTERIVDLDRSVFNDLCGNPVILGLCKVTLRW